MLKSQLTKKLAGAAGDFRTGFVQTLGALIAEVNVLKHPNFCVKFAAAASCVAKYRVARTFDLAQIPQRVKCRSTDANARASGRSDHAD
jgi:hypothetical protein